MKDQWKSNINVWFTFMYSQKWNCYFQNRIIMICLPVPTLIYLWKIYMFPGLVCLFGCSKIGIPILKEKKSLTDTWMWKLREIVLEITRPCCFISGNTQIGTKHLYIYIYIRISSALHLQCPKFRNLLHGDVTVHSSPQIFPSCTCFLHTVLSNVTKNNFEHKRLHPCRIQRKT